MNSKGSWIISRGAVFVFVVVIVVAIYRHLVMVLLLPAIGRKTKMVVDLTSVAVFFVFSSFSNNCSQPSSSHSAPLYPYALIYVILRMYLNVVDYISGTPYVTLFTTVYLIA